MIAIMRFPQAMRASPKPFAFITLIFYFCHKFPVGRRTVKNLLMYRFPIITDFPHPVKSKVEFIKFIKLSSF